MKKLLLLLVIITLLASCQNTKTCISKLQSGDNTVYSIDSFNYIVIEDSIVYHYIPYYRNCSTDEYTRIKIK
jgi:hypothetical protein